MRLQTIFNVAGKPGLNSPPGPPRKDVNQIRILHGPKGPARPIGVSGKTVSTVSRGCQG